MMINDPAVRRYCRAIRSWLPCSRKLKKQIMGQIQNRVHDFLTHNPDADITELQAEFGVPQTIAAAYVENTNTEEILRGLRMRRRIVAIVVTAVIIALLALAAVITMEFVEFKNTANGYLVAAIY